MHELVEAMRERERESGEEAIVTKGKS